MRHDPVGIRRESPWYNRRQCRENDEKLRKITRNFTPNSWCPWRTLKTICIDDKDVMKTTNHNHCDNSTRMKEHRMRVFENRVLRKALCTRWKVIGRDWIRIFSFNKYSGDQIKNIRKSEACGAYVEWKGANGALVGNRQLVKLRCWWKENINPYPTAFPYGNGMVLHLYQQQESSTTKTVHKVINKRLKAYVWSPHTGENFH